MKTEPVTLGPVRRGEGGEGSEWLLVGQAENSGRGRAALALGRGQTSAVDGTVRAV